MYDWPEVRWATDQLWHGISLALTDAGFAAPRELERILPVDAVWTDPALLLSQTCGWPYVTRLSARVQLVGTPIYHAQGCSGPLYSSAIIARKRLRSLADLAGQVVGVNGRDSMSGYVALFDALRSSGVRPADVQTEETGSHRASIRAVADGSVDFAAIDAVCWALARDHEAEAFAELHVLQWTALRPGLPLITSLARSEAELATLRNVVARVIASSAMVDATTALHIGGLAILPHSDYAALRSLAG